ncbi:DoxX family protein [Streptomyces sp. NBC_01352]|uniref:DoxX family protein n=1 Tax=Streptomyces sp. NBC_01352 TaxID=2903834 RepID=UPI002E32B01B|nr:DoxX family protein [Streptomyces sp. NBC_01352]
MNVLLWIVQSLLAVVFVALGTMKFVRTRAQLASVFAWVEQFSDATVKAIGLLEIMVGLGLIIPAVVNIAPVLVPLAAVGGALLAIGGSVVHLRRSETLPAAINLVYIALLALIVWGRFGPYQF